MLFSRAGGEYRLPVPYFQMKGRAKMAGCFLCPRRCGADREKEKGYCGCDARVRIARAGRHFWEEPCISGKNGSGAVFFIGCPLHCVYCQNREISAGVCDDSPERAFDTAALAELFLHLQDIGCHNINLVTPTPYADKIVLALREAKPKLRIPVVFNCGGYESVPALKMLEGLVDIYLTDFKYASGELAAHFSSAEDYPQVAEEALAEMLRQTGAPRQSTDGMLESGVIVRHLVLPGHRADSMRVLDKVFAAAGNGGVLLSLMSQYAPNGAETEFRELSRRVTTFEYESVVKYARSLGFEGYTQERSSAESAYTPQFDKRGIKPALDNSGFRW